MSNILYTAFANQSMLLIENTIVHCLFIFVHSATVLTDTTFNFFLIGNFNFPNFSYVTNVNKTRQHQKSRNKPKRQ